MKLNLKRKSDIWVSNNRVLVGNNKKITGRNPNFDLDETKLLIKLWGDPKIQRTLITSHKKYAVIVKLAEKMKGYGYQRSPEEINTRIKNLKCFYNRLKKDLELGAISTPSWKHYSTMDEIMTRQIFSVRPNEIPKPSLSYRLQEESRERAEREERRARAVAEQSSTVINDSNTHDDVLDNDDVMVVTTPDISGEIDQMEMDNDERLIKLKDEPNSIDEFDESIMNIKEEPNDYEDMKGYEEEESEDGLTNASDFLELSETDDTPPPPKIPSPVTTLTRSRSKVTSTSNYRKKISKPTATETTFSVQKPVYVSNQNQKLVSQQNGKISLVPTSMLLQQQPSTKPMLQSVLQPVIQPQIQIRSPQNQHQQHRILYTQPNTQQQQTGLVTTGPGGMMNGMKVLFVKANGSNGTELVQGNSKVHNGNIQTATIPSTNLNNFLPGPSNIKINNARTTTLEDYLDKDEKDNHNFQALQALLSNLIQLQSDNNEIQRQRLDLERERLVFEKSIADKLVIASPHLFQSSKEDPQQMPSTKEPMTKIYMMEPVINEHMDKLPATQEIVENENKESATLPLLVPKVEKED